MPRRRRKCVTGSIEQKLDMCEEGPMRGEASLHENRRDEQDIYKAGYEVNLAENNREGGEESGDDHSLGLQGDEAELMDQDNAESGMPGEMTEQEEREVDRENKEEAA